MRSKLLVFAKFQIRNILFPPMKSESKNRSINVCRKKNSWQIIGCFATVAGDLNFCAFVPNIAQHEAIVLFLKQKQSMPSKNVTLYTHKERYAFACKRMGIHCAGSCLISGTSDQNVGPSVSFTIENGPPWNHSG